MEANRIITGDCLSGLKTLPDESVDCCVTSPPYWGLRDYGTATWQGGDADCDHKHYLGGNGDKSKKQVSSNGTQQYYFTNTCGKCGATRIDDQIGLEQTPEEYVAKMVAVFLELRRVLKPDGTLWLNIGDSYCGTGSKGDCKDPKYKDGRNGQSVALNNKIDGLKPKDLVGIPWMLAFALRADGWYLRQDIIWHKPNPMPESVTDRCTKSHEYIFLLSKSQKYYYDAAAIAEKAQPHQGRVLENRSSGTGLARGLNGQADRQGNFESALNGCRNKRDVWTVATKPFAEAHFATFPEELIEPCILAGCPENGIVLDPFGGAGTTAVVAIKNKRRYILLELNPEYVEIAEKRIAIAAAEKRFTDSQIAIFDIKPELRPEQMSIGESL